MNLLFFESQESFRDWLDTHHKTETELWVGFHKVSTNKSSMTWSQSVDEALCYGWIDGLRKTVDSDNYCIRFTPRRPNSIWSDINIRKVEEMSEKGLMQLAGLEAYSKRKEERSRVYSFESDTKAFTDKFETLFKSHTKAWDYFMAQAPSYKKMVIHWIMSAKQEQTQLSRLEKAIVECETQNRLWINSK